MHIHSNTCTHAFSHTYAQHTHIHGERELQWHRLFVCIKNLKMIEKWLIAVGSSSAVSGVAAAAAAAVSLSERWAREEATQCQRACVCVLAFMAHTYSCASVCVCVKCIFFAAAFFVAQQQLTAAILMIDMRSLQCVTQPTAQRPPIPSLSSELYDNIYVCLAQKIVGSRECGPLPVDGSTLK